MIFYKTYAIIITETRNNIIEKRGKEKMEQKLLMQNLTVILGQRLFSIKNRRVNC